MISVIDEKPTTATDAEPTSANSSQRNTSNQSLCEQNDEKDESCEMDDIIGSNGREGENKDKITSILLSATSSNNTSTKGNPPLTTDVRKEKTSDLMSRLRTFLPQLQSANQELLTASLLSERPSSAPFAGSGEGPVDSDRIRLDANLKADNGSDSDSDIDDQDAENHPLIQEVGAEIPANEKTNEENKLGSDLQNDEKGGPTIQLEFTLGDMSNNPLMELLANDDSGDSDSDKSSVSDSGKNDDPPTAVRREAVASLLQPLEESKSSDRGIDKRMTNDNLLLFNEITSGSGGGDYDSNKNAGKKRLITELS